MTVAQHKITYVTEVLDCFAVDHQGTSLEWFIKRGDSVFSAEERVIETKPFFASPHRLDQHGRQKFAIYRLEDRKWDLNDLPDDYKKAHEELVEVKAIYLGSHSGPLSNVLAAVNVQAGAVKWRFTLKDTLLKAELFVNDTMVDRCDITIELATPRTASPRRGAYGNYRPEVPAPAMY